jgi:hypothetical protein
LLDEEIIPAGFGATGIMQGGVDRKGSRGLILVPTTDNSATTH